MVVKIGNSPSALMILESVSNDEYTWISADGVYFVLKKGRLSKQMVSPIIFMKQYHHLLTGKKQLD